MIVERGESRPEAGPALPADDDERPGDPVGPSSRRRVVRLVAVVMAVVVVALVVDAIVLWTRVDRFPLRRTGSAPGGTTYLLLGSDSRGFVETEEDRVRFGSAAENPGERADVLLLVRVDRDGGRRLLSVSRDLLVVGEQDALIRIAETFGRHGPQGVVDALCVSVGIGVDHVAVTRLDGLRAVVDAVGGIDLRLETAIRDAGSGLHLPAGTSHLDGSTALQYVSSRRLEHEERDGRWRRRPTDAADRPGRVAEVLGIVGSEADVSPWSPIRSQRIVWAATTALSVDDDLGIGEALDLRSTLGGFGALEVGALPVTSSEGALTIDQAAPGAGRALDRFEAGTRAAGRCDAPKLPAAAR